MLGLSRLVLIGSEVSGDSLSLVLLSSVSLELLQTLDLEVVVEELLLLELAEQEVLDDGDGSSVLVEEVGESGLTVIVVDDVGHLIVSEIEVGLGVTIILSIQALSLEVSGNVVSHNRELGESSPEGLGGGDVVDVSQTEDVLVLSVSESSGIDIEHPVGLSSGESGIDERGVRLGGDESVEVVVGSLLTLLGVDILEGGSLGVHVNSDESPAVLNLDSELVDLLLDELVGDFEVLNELVVSVYDGEGVLGGQLAMSGVPLPDLVGDEEVVSSDFSLEGVGRNAEVGISGGEVEVPSGVLVEDGSPGGVVLASEDGVLRVLPGLLESLDALEVLVQSHSDDELVVGDSSSGSEDDCVVFRENLVDSNVVGVSGVHGEGELCVSEVLSLVGSLLLVDSSHGVLLVDDAVEDDHDVVFAVRGLVKVSGQDTSEVASDDDNVVLLQILASGLTLAEQTRESARCGLMQAVRADFPEHGF